MNRAGKGQWSKTGGKKGGEGQEKGGKGDTRVSWSCGKTGLEHLNAVEDISEEVREDDDELHAWCLREEREDEQWQEVTSKTRVTAESRKKNSGASPKKVIGVKGNWVNVRATVDTGATGHVMQAEMFLRVKLDRTTKTKKFVAANGERIKDLSEKTIPFKSVEGVHRCKKSGVRML